MSEAPSLSRGRARRPDPVPGLAALAVVGVAILFEIVDYVLIVMLTVSVFRADRALGIPHRKTVLLLAGVVAVAFIANLVLKWLRAQ